RQRNKIAAQDQLPAIALENQHRKRRDTQGNGDNIDHTDEPAPNHTEYPNNTHCHRHEDTYIDNDLMLRAASNTLPDIGTHHRAYRAKVSEKIVYVPG